jgi:predicted ATPase/DNA-binding CsgD family transcriptional regulator
LERHGALPLRLTSFIGREQAMDELAAQLGRSRLVTLTGPPGCGKTRLAIETVRRHEGGGRPAIFVGLDSIEAGPSVDRSAAAVVDAVALALGVVDGGTRPLLDDVAAVADRPVLLILDNCEHVIDACTGIVTDLLGRLPRLSVLATSRRDLAIDGEVVWRVPPLSLPDDGDGDEGPPGGPMARLQGCESGRLLLDRVHLARPGPPLTDDQADLMTMICSAVEGIPFDIELAVGRLDAMDLETLVDHLTRGEMRVLRAAAPGARPRSTSDSIARSYELLSPGEQRLLRRLVVFAATFGRDAAHAVGAEPGQSVLEIGEMLARLARTSMIQPEGRFTPRFRLLPSIRAFCGERVTDEEAGLMADRHLRYHVGLADRLRRSVFGPTDLATFLYQAAASLDDFRKAADWAVTSGQPVEGLRLVTGLRWLWIDVGRLPEGRRRIGDLLARAPEADALVRGQAAVAGGTLALFAADPLALAPLADLAVEQGRVAGDPEVEGEGLALQGWAAIFLDPPSARRPLGTGRDQLAALGHPLARWATIGMGIALGHEGRMTEAVAELHAAVDGDGPSSWLSPFALATLGYLETLQGDFASAERHLVLARGDTTPDTFVLQVGQWYALLRTYQGRYEEAEHAFATALRGAAGGAFVPGWLHYGIFEYGRGNLDRAEELVDQSLIYFKAMRWQLFEAQAERVLGDIAARRGDAAGAGRHRDRALTAADACRNPLAVANAAPARGLEHLDDGDLTGARSRLSRALRSAVDVTYVLGVVEGLELFARIEARAGTGGRPADALRALAAADARRERIGFVPLPVEQPTLERVTKALRDELGEDEADTIWDEGRRLSLVDAAAACTRGRRRRPRPQFGVESLTPPERRVAELVADGLTNAEIAGILHKSRATVKHQISSTLTKLGLRGRGDLAAFVARQRAQDAW